MKVKPVRGGKILTSLSLIFVQIVRTNQYFAREYNFKYLYLCVHDSHDFILVLFGSIGYKISLSQDKDYIAAPSQSHFPKKQGF